MGTVRLGLDIGQSADFTALVVSEEEDREDGEHYIARMVERLPLGMSYPLQVDRVAEVMANLDMMSDAREEAGGEGFVVELYVDATGVGRPVIDLLRDRYLKPVAVTLTGGDALTEREGEQVSMGKSYLVSRLQVLLQSGRLHLPDTPEGDLLTAELKDYRTAVSDRGHASFNARSGAHDDLVIAAGLSTGTGERPKPTYGGFVMVGSVRSRWISGSLPDGW